MAGEQNQVGGWVLNGPCTKNGFYILKVPSDSKYLLLAPYRKNMMISALY